MLALLATLQARILPRGWLDALRQLALFAGAYYGYRFVRGAVDGRATDAYEHARDLISFERGLNAFIEPSLQAWANGEAWLIDSASWMYVNSHFTITVSSLVFIYLFRNSSFYFVRNMFCISMVMALIGYVVFPTAPPRFFPEWGFTDSVAEFTRVPQDSTAVNALFNPFAAVPSMHVAFALMLGLSLVRLVNSRPLKVLWAIYPVVVTFVVLATANHWWTDVALGAVVAGVSAFASHWLLARARPEAWAFTRTAEATA
ncbi:MAG: phosphatase PAP2 family protein [Solirubrobacteraceae bacterium]